MSNVYPLRLLLIVFMMIHFSGVSQYKKEYWDSRDQWQKTPELIKLMGLKKDMKVADVGCHEGYMTIHLSDFLSNKGKVYAVDVVESRINKLKKFIKEDKRTNVIPIVGKYDDPLLPKNILDAVIIMDTYHEIDAYNKVLKKVYKSLKKGGKILILEEIKTYRIKDSRSSQTSRHDIALRYVKKDLKKAGFTIEKEIPDFGRWENKEEEQMWILVAKKE
ncbi:class I SAM-dependent methyltransferase [Pseudotenacibaculum sp. MALMAid0570]|uniref:class I SAM-dependent methyltransferase n=1 Tax=Pseudotenacibaculum sp. MALMAid0570 TaxID=3143938 RepID=UPI0032DE8CA5